MSNNLRFGLRLLGAIGLLYAQLTFAATISIHNIDAAGTGFNDPTPVSPVGGNAGTTLGQQRLNVFQAAANQWGALLQSNVPIKVQASMTATALDCSATSATLGSAGPLSDVAPVPNGRTNTAYSIAEANALAGSDLFPSDDDITAQFNAKLDAGDPTCLGGEKWWYGLDPSVSPPANTVPLLPVVFHELGHGLGFEIGVDENTGDFFSSTFIPIWAYYLFDIKANAVWKDMSSPQRLASITDDPNLVWTGPRTNKQAHEWLKAGNSLIVNAPAALSGNQEVGTATFGPTVPAAGVPSSAFQNLVLVNDGSATPTLGCATPFTNPSVNGKIAVMDRGTCNFTVKVKNAQTAGAIAAIIVNNMVDGLRLPLTMTGTDATITIPSYSVTQALGQAIEADLNVSTTVTAKLGYANLGINQGCVRMFAPNPVLPGSSVSHFHADAVPNLLMEPALNTTIFNKVDLTLPLFADIDWGTNSEEFIFIDGYDLNPCAHVQP